MRSRLGLVALWAAFAAASVGVGFGAAGLVGDPFTDPGGDQVNLSDAGGSGTADASSGAATPAPTPSRSRTRSPGPSATGTPTADRVIRSLTTRGGIVSGSCSSGRVTISAAPANGWAIKDVDGGPTIEARVRFERTADGDGRVEVRARCSSGVPRFTVDDRTDSSGRGGGGSDGGGSGPG